MVGGQSLGWRRERGTRKRAHRRTGAEKRSTVAPAVNDVIGVACVLRAVLGPRGTRGAAGKGWGGRLPPPAPPPPALPSCDVSAWPLASPFCSAAPHPQGLGGQAPNPALPFTRCPGGACNAAAVSGTWGEWREEEKEEGKRPQVPLCLLLAVRPHRPILLAGTPKDGPSSALTRKRICRGVGPRVGCRR